MAASALAKPEPTTDTAEDASVTLAAPVHEGFFKRLELWFESEF